MKIVYLAGPYRGANPAEIERNIRTAQRYAMALTEAGIAVYSPHLNTAHFDGLQPDQFFLDHGLEMLRRCDALVVMPGSWDSIGTQREIKAAIGNMLIYHVAEYDEDPHDHPAGIMWCERDFLDKQFWQFNLRDLAKHISIDHVLLDSLPPRNQEGE